MENMESEVISSPTQEELEKYDYLIDLLHKDKIIRGIFSSLQLPRLSLHKEILLI